MENLMTVTEYARYRKERGLNGGTRQAVYKALRTRRIRKESCGRINAQKADQEWLVTTQFRFNWNHLKNQ